MLKKLKYCLSHTALYTADMLREHSRFDLLLHYAGYSCNVFLLVALGLGLYTRWSLTHDGIIVLLGFLAIFVFSISCAMVYYFSMHTIGFSFMRLWIGCLQGVLAFTPEEGGNAIEETVNFLLVSSLLIRCVWAVLERIRHFVTYTTVLNSLESLEMLGMCVAAIACGKDLLSISLLVTGLALTLIAIRLKSYLAVLNLICMVSIISAVFFPLVQISASPVVLLCFTGRMTLEPILDLYFCGWSTLERWTPLLQVSSLLQKGVILCVTVAEVAFLAFNAMQIPHHKEWYVVVPIFMALTVAWLAYHLVFVVTCWQLSSKLSDCVSTYHSMKEDRRNLPGIMAAKGVRHFSLVCQRLVLVALLLTIVLGATGWTTRTACSLALLFVVLPLEIAVLSLLWELGATLGGTCIGYALVAPVFQQQLGEGTMVLPTNTVQEMSGHAMRTLSAVQQFFTFHLVDNFGCDYSSSGLTVESVQSKLRSFFQQSTADGPRYDTYLVYYSGQVYENGQWALAGSESLSLDTILEWWGESNQCSGSRLIFVLDTKHSKEWLRDVASLQEHVALQACSMTTITDPETGSRPAVGDFTVEWVDYNCDNEMGINFLGRGHSIVAQYSVSRNWTDFTFHLPTEEDMQHHWQAHFSGLRCKPFIKATNFLDCGMLFCCCDCIVRCLRRKKMAWLPPHDLDTGHGFRLVRSS